ncbi:MAG: class I SAM-dependent rRNA methyltransferase [Lautropia sp.]
MSGAGRSGGGAAAVVALRAGKERPLLRRHPWVFSNAVARVGGSPQPGETVRVQAADGRFLAWAAFSPHSTIRARCWSFVESQRVDAALLDARVAAAVRARAALAARTDAIRLVFGEADGLPGLVVDRYADTLVLQFLSAGVEHWRDALVDAVRRHVPSARAGYERSDASVREREGLASRTGPLWGDPAPVVRVREDGIDYRVDIVSGHKTGFYIDQRDNRRRVRELVAAMVDSGTGTAAAAPQVRVLNCFCYTGGFSLAALAGGASLVHSIDSSADALATGRDLVALNGFAAGGAARDEWVEANVFDALKRLDAADARFDLVVLDPPKFAASAAHVERAARAYKEINLKAMRLLAPGGHLLTFSCSGAIGVDLFQKIVAGAVFDAGVDLQLLARLQAGTDHPMAMTHPEGEYLKGLLLRRP